jgi:hypothetical protein
VTLSCYADGLLPLLARAHDVVPGIQKSFDDLDIAQGSCHMKRVLVVAIAVLLASILLDEERQYLNMASYDRHMEWGDPIAVGGVDIGSMMHKDLGDVRAAAADRSI